MAPGLVAAGSLPFEPTPAMQEYSAAFSKAFPALPATAAFNPLAVPYATGVEAVLLALERTEGALGEPFTPELAKIQVESPAGRIRLDEFHQAVAPNYLTQVAKKKGAAPFTTLEVVPDVEQTFGGYFEPGDAPSRTSPACKRGNPPPWAKG
jgi:hypothetical protein